MVIYKKFINIEKLDFATFTPMLNIELQCNVRNVQEKITLYIYIYICICIEIRVT